MFGIVVTLSNCCNPI